MGRFLLIVGAAVVVGFVVGLAGVLLALAADDDAFVEEDPYGDGLYGP